MFGLWRTYRGRRAAAAEIIPLIDGTRSRFGNMLEAAWHDPYVIGFLGMLITMIATRAAGHLDRDDLAAVQSKAWMDITGASGDLFGEELCFYDAAGEHRFLSGCRNAEAFFQARAVARHQIEQTLGPGASAPLMGHEGDVELAIWRRYFEAHVVARGI